MQVLWFQELHVRSRGQNCKFVVPPVSKCRALRVVGPQILIHHCQDFTVQTRCGTEQSVKQTPVAQKWYPFPGSYIHCGYVTGIFKTPVHLEQSQVCNTLECCWLTSKRMYHYCHQNTEGTRAKIHTRSNVRYACFFKMLTISSH